MAARVFAALFFVLLAGHLCHTRVLWAEEGLPLAAARQMEAGKALYKDAWFDKPPVVPSVYLIWGARDGWPLRLAGAVYDLVACWLAFLTARRLFGETAGLWAAVLLGFFLLFDTASAVIPLAADLLMLVPHLGAIWMAVERRPVLSGVFAGAAFLTNTKGIFVLASCAVFLWPLLPQLFAGFLIPCAAAGLALFAAGAWPFYWDQVWVWSSRYAASSHVSNPFGNGISRTLNWLGFHSVLLAGIGLGWARLRPVRWRLAAWGLFSFAGVVLGWRFFPRYYFQLLPVLVIAASAGFAYLQRRQVWALLLLLIPAVRFAPRYVLLAAGRSEQWADTAMDRESRRAADIAKTGSHPGDTLFVWGFRPDLFVDTGLPAATRFLDCQALTGVPADRHLTQSTPVVTGTTAAARQELSRARPTIVIDGLSLYNPALAITSYPELRDWMAHYTEIGRTGNVIVYRLREL